TPTSNKPAVTNPVGPTPASLEKEPSDFWPRTLRYSTARSTICLYSFWAAAEDALNTDDILTLTASRDAGLDHITEISRVYSQERARGFEPDFYANYLTENIQFKLGKAELEGLKEYYSYCFYYGIIDEIPDLLFVGQENESDFTVKNN
ncbi:MAG TPA: hypothetical protein PKI67_12835, partial [bacterium]|nr:hypothetical protein [bacterium]